MENKVISIVSGGFDPVHPGHIMMMNDCLDFSDYLVVGVNSNQWLINKKGCLLYTSPSPRDGLLSRMPSSA